MSALVSKTSAGSTLWRSAGLRACAASRRIAAKFSLEDGFNRRVVSTGSRYTHGIPTRAEVLAMPPDVRREAQRRIRDQLSDIFVPISFDLVDAVRREVEAYPATSLPRLGEEPAIRGFSWLRWMRFKSHLAFDRARFVVADRQVLARHRPTRPVRIAKGGPLFDRFSRMITQKIDANVLDVAVVVGDHGPRLATAIARAAQTIRAVIDRDLRDRADALTEQHTDILREWTFQKSVTNALLEGAQSLAAATALLTFHRVPGRSVDEILRDIEREHLLARLAAGPLDFVGPMNAYGIVPRECVRYDDEGKKLALSPVLEELMAQARLRGVVTPQHARETKLGCPVVKIIDSEGAPYRGPDSLANVLGSFFLRLVREGYAAGE
jgi:hypothetical protein